MSHKLYTKILPALALSFVACASSAQAADQKAQPPMQKTMAPSGMVNPPANPPAQNGIGLWVQAEALYLRAHEDNMPFAIESSSGSNEPSLGRLNSATINGPVKSINFQWDWGCRAGIGYNLPHDGWDILLNWTHLKTNQTNNVLAASDKYLFPTVEKSMGRPSLSGYGIQDSFFIAQNATAKLNLTLNILDLGMGREFFVSKYMTLRPHVGARGGWFKRNLKTTFGGSIPGGVAMYDAEDNWWMLRNNQLLKDSYQNEFNGGGLFGGLDAEWGLGYGMSFYSQFDFALLYGTQTSKSLEVFDTLAVDTVTPSSILRWSDSYQRKQTRPMTDLAFGIRWEMPFSQDAYRIRLQLGWEQHIIFNFSQDLMVYTNVANQKEDLSLTGVSFQGRFDF